MVKKIKDIVYDECYAKEVARVGGHGSRGDAEFFEEILYMKDDGTFFLYGEGGPYTKYGHLDGDFLVGSWDIIPMTEEEAESWLEEQRKSGNL